MDAAMGTVSICGMHTCDAMWLVTEHLQTFQGRGRQPAYVHQMKATFQKLV